MARQEGRRHQIVGVVGDCRRLVTGGVRFTVDGLFREAVVVGHQGEGCADDGRGELAADVIDQSLLQAAFGQMLSCLGVEGPGEEVANVGYLEPAISVPDRQEDGVPSILQPLRQRLFQLLQLVVINAEHRGHSSLHPVQQPSPGQETPRVLGSDLHQTRQNLHLVGQERHADRRIASDPDGLRNQAVVEEPLLCFERGLGFRLSGLHLIDDLDRLTQGLAELVEVGDAVQELGAGGHQPA